MQLNKYIKLFLFVFLDPYNIPFTKTPFISMVLVEKINAVHSLSAPARLLFHNFPSPTVNGVLLF